jgi:hypothetical protein
MVDDAKLHHSVNRSLSYRGCLVFRSLSFACAALSTAVMLMLCGTSYAGGNDNQISPFPIQQGKAIAPVPLNLTGKDPGQVYLGSYIVNGIGDCSGCHSFPQYLEKGNMAGNNPAAGDPYEGKPSDQSVNRQLAANFNSAHYLAGGQCFGPFMARNLTPEPSNGMPEGLTEAEFIKVLRTGDDIHCDNNHEPDDPICALGPPTDVLQVMPWPTYHSMTDADLKAIYAYLTAIPTAGPCNTVDDGCPGFSGKAATTPNTYAFANTDTCPNGANGPPPQ